MTGPTLRLAHRGDHRRWIENTADALLDACALPGIDGVEFDVRMSADGEPVILHDESLARTFGLPLVAGATPTLDLLRVGVPHLADLLALLPADAFLDIELKEPASTATLDAIVRARGTSLRRGIVSSFDAPRSPRSARVSPASRAGSTPWSSIAGRSRRPGPLERRASLRSGRASARRRSRKPRPPVSLWRRGRSAAARRECAWSAWASRPRSSRARRSRPGRADRDPRARARHGAAIAALRKTEHVDAHFDIVAGNGTRGQPKRAANGGFTRALEARWATASR
jgi:hypothetical protein